MRVVIVGAGTAGCVLAARLSEDPGTEVVVLEAGPHYAPGQWPPELSHAYRIIKETHDWEYLAQAGASPRLVHVPRGRVVGGSSITNAAIALRGLPEHYDEWSEFVDGYDWASMLPWFCAIENDGQFSEAEYHGDSGPIAINRYPRESWYPLLESFAEAALARGHAWIEDHNAPGATGIGPASFNMIDGIRQTPADHYLAPALERSNLSLVSGVTADTVQIHSEAVTHVEGIDDSGQRMRFEADEIIVCLGTYATPAFLMRSGIGPPDAITPHGIPMTHRMDAVGRGMQDHPKVSYRFWVSTEIPEWPHPWIQALLTATCEIDGQERLFQVMPYSGTTQGGHQFTDLNVQVADARGRTGTVDIQGPDPHLQPVLKMGWLEREDDRAVAEAAGSELMALAQTHPLKDVVCPWPNQEDRDHPLRTVETFHHPVGTCRMGRESDPSAVVDGSGRVLGLRGLSVMDASIIPRVPSANTHLCVIALAERLAASFREANGGK